MKKFFGLLLAAVMTFSLVACGAQDVPSDNTSDDYPRGPITCIVPYAAGGGSDVLKIMHSIWPIRILHPACIFLPFCFWHK